MSNDKFVPFEKMGKKAKKEYLKRGRKLFEKIQTTVPHKSKKDYNRKKEHEKLKLMEQDEQDLLPKSYFY